MKYFTLLRILLIAALLMSCNFVTTRMGENPGKVVGGEATSTIVSPPPVEPTATIESPLPLDTPTPTPTALAQPASVQGWKINQEVAMEGVNFTYKGLNCGAVDGPWKITYDGAMAEGVFQGDVDATFGGDGVGTARWNMNFRAHGWDAGMFATGVGTVTLQPKEGGYHMTFGSTNWDSTGFVENYTANLDMWDTSIVTLRVEPADAEQCK